MKTLITALLILLYSASAYAVTASQAKKIVDDCYKTVTTSLQKDQCATQESTYYDNQLTQTYNALKKLLSNADQKLLQQTQTAWKNYREKECEFSMLQYAKSQPGALTPDGCYNKLTQERVYVLDQYIKIFKAKQ